MEREDEQLNGLFAAYRKACPDPEPSPEFMPDVWSKIEARRSFTLSLRRWTSAFVTAAAALSIGMAVYTDQPVESPVYTTTYVDTLGADESLEMLAYADLVSFEPSEGVDIR